MVLAQLVAFGRVSQERQSVRDRKEALKLRKQEVEDAKNDRVMNGSIGLNGVPISNGGSKLNGTACMDTAKCTELPDKLMGFQREDTDDTDETEEMQETDEDEMML